MTIEERGKKVAGDLPGWGYADPEREALAGAIAEQIRGAVAEERERCVALVRHCLMFDSQRAASWHEVQDAIRSIREGRQVKDGVAQ